MRILRRLSMGLLLIASALWLAVTLQAAEPVSVIFDTDMAGDCDDAGALAVLNALADRGEAEILAVVTNRKDPAGLSGAACDVINTFYGRPDVPIGTDKDGARAKWKGGSSYTPVLAKEFAHDSPVDAELPDAIDVYRRTLASAGDQSVVICSVGALSNLQDLLNSSADKHSRLSGAELIRKKVRQTVIMGGAFPRSAKPETNVLLDPPASVAVVNDWPGPIVWQGFEVGAALHCGAGLKRAASNNPVRRAFEVRPYLGQFAIDHGKPAHDQAAVLIAVRGPEPSLWKVSAKGRVVVDSDGHNEWYPGANHQHQYVSIKGRPDRLIQMIEELMLK